MYVLITAQECKLEQIFSGHELRRNFTGLQLTQSLN